MKKFILLFSLFSSIVVFSQNNNKSSETGRNTEDQELFGQGISKMKKKKYSEAITIFDDLVKKQPNFVANYYYLAQAYFENKQFEECVQACSKGINLDERENSLYLYRAQANIELNKTENVCGDLKKSATTDEQLLKYCK